MAETEKENRLLLYFRERSKGAEVAYQRHFKTGNHVFRFDVRGSLQFVRLSEEYIDDHDYDQIVRAVSGLITAILEGPGRHNYIVTNEGIRDEQAE